MPILYRTSQYTQYNLIQEDPDPVKNRIFIENMGCDIKNLNVRFGEYYQRPGTDGVFAPTGADDFSNYPPVYTQNKSAYFIATYANQGNENSPGHCDPWFASLDYENYPGVRSVKTSSGLIAVGRYSGYSTSLALADWWVGYDMNDSPTYLLENNGSLSTMFYEDPQQPGEFFGIRYYVGTSYIGKMRFTPLSATFTDQRSIGGWNVFFVGKCGDNTAMFVEVNGNNQNMDFYNYSSSGAPTLIYSYIHKNPNTYHYQYPSNLKHVSDTKKVFYQGGWDEHPFQEYKQCFFQRFIFNPQDKRITASPCTINFPEGKNSTNFQVPAWYDATWHASTRNAWYYKPHQFSVGNRTFVTYIFVDKYHHNYWQNRIAYYRGPDTRCNWMTFEVDSNDDTILNFHSVIQWEESRSFPRYYMPINQTGTQLLIILNENVCTVSFDIESGWYKHDFENISARSAAIDTAGRIYLITTGANTYYDTNANRYDNSKGYGFLRTYQYNPTVPVTLSVRFENNSFTYTGTQITTNLLADVRNSNGNREVRNLRVTFSGDNIFFQDGTQSKDITTLTSGTLSVPVNITGGGKPVVLVTVI